MGHHEFKIKNLDLLASQSLLARLMVIFQIYLYDGIMIHLLPSAIKVDVRLLISHIILTSYIVRYDKTAT
jgi:hypothetical protein